MRNCEPEVSAAATPTPAGTPTPAATLTPAGERWRARLVAYGMVLMLVVCAVFTLEPWPLTSLRLFSQIRTDRQTQVQLVVVEAEGTRRVIDFGDNAFVSDSAQRRLPEIASLPVAEQRSAVEDVLKVAGVDPTTVDAVAVSRTVRRLDADGGPATVLSSRDVVTVELP